MLSVIMAFQTTIVRTRTHQSGFSFWTGGFPTAGRPFRLRQLRYNTRSERTGLLNSDVAHAVDLHGPTDLCSFPSWLVEDGNCSAPPIKPGPTIPKSS